MLNEDDYHKRYHNKALAGMERLSLELRGAYQTIQDLYYQRGGPAPDVTEEDAKWWASKMNCSTRKWRSVRDQLLALGRITKDADGFIRDEACDAVLAERAAARASNQKNGAVGGRKRAESAASFERTGDELQPKSPRTYDETEGGAGKNKGLGQAPLGSKASILESEEENIDSLFSFDADWAPDAADVEAGRALGLDPWEVEAAGATHAAWWRANAPHVKKTAGGWRLQFHDRLRDVVNDPKARARLTKPKPAANVAPLDLPSSPDWWARAAEKLSKADPGAWRSYWSHCEVLSEDSPRLRAANHTAFERLKLLADSSRGLLGCLIEIEPPAPRLRVVGE